MVMRVGGLATGMDLEAMVNKLMEAERMPLIRMEQDKQKLEWKRDAFRDINRSVLDIESLLFDMKMSYTYNPKMVISSQENAITATAKSNSHNGMYELNVTQLATSEINVGGVLDGIDPNAALELNENQRSFSFQTFDPGENQMKTHSYQIEEGETLNDVLRKITNDDNNVRAFYDAQSKRVVLETTRTGKYNEQGPEIVFNADDNAFFTEKLGLTTEAYNSETKTGVRAAQNAIFTYNNGLEIETENNSYELNGIHFQFHNVTDGNARLIVETDVETSFESIMGLIDTYNELIEKMNQSQTEKVNRDYPPLTDEQKEEMTEDQIEKWEEQAKSGILRGESVISNNMYSMRRTWYSQVDTGTSITSINDIGITTSNNYLDGGKLVVDENKLKEALRDNPDAVYKLFSNNTDDNSRGIVNRLEETVKNTKNRIEERAGKSTHTLDNYTLGKRLKELNERISDFEKRMMQVETRYWNQFTQMEKAIQRMNDQSAHLLSQFGGGF